MGSLTLEWQLPENRRSDYVPPLVLAGLVTAVQFWTMAVHNSALRNDDPTLIDHAERMLAIAKEAT